MWFLDLCAVVEFCTSSTWTPKNTSFRAGHPSETRCDKKHMCDFKMGTHLKNHTFCQISHIWSGPCKKKMCSVISNWGHTLECGLKKYQFSKKKMRNCLLYVMVMVRPGAWWRSFLVGHMWRQRPTTRRAYSPACDPPWDPFAEITDTFRFRQYHCYFIFKDEVYLLRYCWSSHDHF